MRTTRSIATAALVGGLLMAPAAGVLAAAPEESFLVVDGAQEVERFLLSPTVQQVNYVVDIDYPGQAVGTPQWQQLETVGWHKCRSAGSEDWTLAVDTSVTPNRTVHERVTNWSKDDQLITIKLRYYSAAGVATPDNDNQQVHLVFYSERAQQMANYLKVDCRQ